MVNAASDSVYPRLIRAAIEARSSVLYRKCFNTLSAAVLAAALRGMQKPKHAGGKNDYTEQLSHGIYPSAIQVSGRIPEANYGFFFQGNNYPEFFYIFLDA